MKVSKNTLLVPIAIAAIVVSVYMSCGELANEDSDGSGSTEFGANATCKAVDTSDSEPQEFSQVCTFRPGCEEDIEIPIQDEGDESTIKVKNVSADAEISHSFNSESRSVVVAAADCPAEESEVTISYTGMAPSDTKVEEKKEIKEVIDDELLSCETVFGFSDPPLINTTCTVKTACGDEGLMFPLITKYQPVNNKVELMIPGTKQPNIPLEYDKVKHEVKIAKVYCDAVDAQFVVTYQGMENGDGGETDSGCSDGADCLDAEDGEGKLYVHPCGNGDPLPASCDNAGGFVAMEDKTAPTCAELNLEAGDPCDLNVAQCIAVPRQACANSPDVKVASTTYHWCRDMPFGQEPCPVSKRRYKQDITYLDEDSKMSLRDEVLNLRLSRYQYKNPELGGGPQLGFIIDDSPKASFVTPNGERVNLYAYMSALVATVQLQQKEIEKLKSKLDGNGR